MIAAALLGIAVPQHLGYLALALLVGGESLGLLLPGETVLLAAAALARYGHLEIALVIPIAATAAILGDNAGYLLGRRGVHHLLVARGPLQGARRTVLERGERFFARHGTKAVFLGRWIAVSRVTVAWLAGATEMRWRSFLLWNALGAIAWATTIGLAGFALGAAAKALVAAEGAVLMALLVAVAGAAAGRRWGRRLTGRRQRGAHGGPGALSTRAQGCPRGERTSVSDVG